MTEDLRDLRKIAEQATNGPWATRLLMATQKTAVHSVDDLGKYSTPVVTRGISAENANHIATFNPETVLALLSRLEQAEQEVASLKAKMDGENLRWKAWEMVENSGHLDLPIVTWINRISDDEVSIEAAKYFFFGGTSPCIHLGSDEPFDIDDEDRPACEHCNRRALGGDGRG